MVRIIVNGSVIDVEDQQTIELKVAYTHELTAQEDIPEFHFVGFDGYLGILETRALGIAQHSKLTGETVTVVTTGKTKVTLDDAVVVNVGDKLTVGNSGKCKKAIGTNIANARALQSGNGGDVIDVIMSNN